LEIRTFSFQFLQRSVFGGSAWTWNEKRGEFFLHQFYPEQPDLNLSNQKVVDLLKEILQFWLDLGVDGFRIDAVAHFFECEFFRFDS
jgi:glycosidase